MHPIPESVLFLTDRLYQQGIDRKRLGYSTYEKELLAMVHAVEKWQPYLLGRRLIVMTNHLSLQHLFTQRIVNPIQQKWLTKLMVYDYETVYKMGSQNTAIDSLS